MHLLYLDHSGEVSDPNQFYMVMAGIACFERQTHWLSAELEKIAGRFNPADPASIELHANPMITGNHGWKAYPVADRRSAVLDALHVAARSHHSNVLFGICKDKRAGKSNDLISEVFEEICNRFDRYLGRLHKRNNTQRGIIVFDKASYETKIQGLAINFRTIGHSWGVIRNLSEVPLFLDSKASRLIQLADLIAWAIRRKFEKGDSTYFDVIAHRFDNEGGRNHGFQHYPFRPE
jgi:hypothetical protein